MRTVLILLVLFVNTTLADALFQEEPLVRVRIIKGVDSLQLVPSSGWSLLIGDSAATALDNDSLISFRAQGTKLNSAVLPKSGVRSFHLKPSTDSATVKILQVPYGVGWWWGGKEDRHYEGTVHVFTDEDNDLCVAIHLPMESYLKGVVPYEIGGDSPLEALKAQAVAARSEAVVALNSELYNGPHHDLTADVECQVFSGNHRRTAASDQAVIETRGMIISEEGQAMNAYYASNCGGRSELISNVWPDRPPMKSYMVSSPDNTERKAPKLNKRLIARWWINRSSAKVYCNPAHEDRLPSWSKQNHRWTREFTREEITRMVSQDQEMGPLKKIKILDRGPSGRIFKARFVFEGGTRDVEGELTLRMLFSPSLRSANFYVKKRGDTFILKGAGWGHGVGMCQSGAVAQAWQGKTYAEILKHYYVHSELLSIYGE